MKSITIPKYNNPFTVNINNKEYTYKGGETIEVPDEVAEAIEDAIELIPKPKRYLSVYDLYVEGSITEIKKEDLKNVRSISSYVFYACQRLENVTIPNGITSIGDSAIRYCKNLKNVDISEDVSSIGSKAFGECTKLERIIVRRHTPPTIQVDTFLYMPSACVVEVPLEAVEAYKSAEHWSAFADRIKAIEE